MGTHLPRHARRQPGPPGSARASAAARTAVLLLALVGGCKGGAEPDLNAYVLAPVSGDSQSAPVGARLADARVRVTLRGQPVAGMLVQWRAYGGARADTTESRSNVEGIASMGWSLGLDPGPQYLTASIPWTTAATYNFRALALAASGAQLPAGASSAAAPLSAAGSVK